MPIPIKRRDFLKAASLAGASLAITNTAAEDFFGDKDPAKIKNSWFVVSFDKKKGMIDVLRTNGTSFLQNGTFAANLVDGSRHSASSKTYRHKSRTESFTDLLGRGHRLVVSSSDTKRRIDFEATISLYDELELISFETVIKNVSSQKILLHSLEPLRVIAGESGSLQVPGIAKVITNGEMYFDTGQIHDFKEDGNIASTGKIKGVDVTNRSISTTTETTHSWWNVGLFSGYQQEALVLGYLQNDLSLGNVLVARTAPGEISFVAESVYAPQLTLLPATSISSNRFVINTGRDPYAALERYAHAVGKIGRARTGSVVNGWCSWFYTLAQVSEDEVIANTKFAAEHLKPYGLEYIQVDEGFQKWHGDWEGNERFPHGMKWLADQVKSHGFKAGMWISPYVVSEPSEVFQKHPDWLLKRSDGSLQRVGNWDEGAEPPADENPKRYCLDITHPEAAKWLHNLIDKIVNDWGYEMIKIDFVAWSILAANKYHDPTLAAAQVYRRGMEIMRNAAGNHCHILECGPGAITVGLIDSMRIELDSNYGFADTAWNTYFNNPASSSAAAGKRYYFHKQTWVNDADHLCMSLLNNQQCEAAASIIALSGGNMMSGDRLTQLTPYKLDILKKITPSFGKAAKPVDLFQSDDHSVFALKIEKPFATWTVAGFFNADLNKSTEKKWPLESFWLDPSKTYLAFDFWKQEFIGEISKEISLDIQPGSVSVITFHEKSGHPQLISTDRHIMQGAIEIEEIIWNREKNILSGVSVGPANSSYNLSVYVPGDHPWTWGGYVLYRDYGDYSLRLVDKNIIQVNVRFGQNPQLNWRIDMDEYFK